MSNLIRWEPAREMMTLREAMDRLFDDAFTRPLGGNGYTTIPAIDMYQTNDDVVVKAAIPGFKAEDVEINITGDVLTMHGEMRQEDETQEKSWQMREHRWGAFERSVVLPTQVVVVIGPSGSGKTFQVGDATGFTDGWGIIAGDQIQLQGSAQRARLVSVDYGSRTLTCDVQLTWSQGQGIGLPYEGAGPDIGAFEFGPTQIKPGPPGNLRVVR